MKLLLIALMILTSVAMARIDVYFGEVRCDTLQADSSITLSGVTTFGDSIHIAGIVIGDGSTMTFYDNAMDALLQFTAATDAAEFYGDVAIDSGLTVTEELTADSIDTQHAVVDVGLTTAGYVEADSTNTDHLVVDTTMDITGDIDQTISTTVVGGETGVNTSVSHITNALTGTLIGVKGNARVNTIDSPAGNVTGGYFQAGNMDVGTDLAGARGVYVDVVNKVPVGATAWDVARGFEASMDLDQGTLGNVNTVTLAQGLYVCYNLPTVDTYATVTTGYGSHVRNEAVGGTGQMLDAAYYADDRSMSGGIFGWDYGLDFGAMGSNGFGSADIRGCNEETIDNVTDGVWNLGDSNVRAMTYNFADATAVGGTANAITMDFVPDLPTLGAGSRVSFIAEGLNTGATTLAIDGGGAVNVYENTDVSACEGGEIVDGMACEFLHDGTQWQIISNQP